MACTVCSNLTPERLQYVKSGQLATIFIDEYDLLESAHSAGCAECKLLFDAISLERDRWPPGKEQSSSIIINVAVGKPVQIIWKKGLSSFRSINDPTSKEAQEIPSVIGIAPLVPKDSGSEECLSLLQSWYLDCKDSHTLCQSKTHSVLPTRVIDVGSNLTIMANVSLAETKGAQGDYMALSYCWGDPEVHKALKTTHSNIDQFNRSGRTRAQVWCGGNLCNSVCNAGEQVEALVEKHAVDCGERKDDLISGDDFAVGTKTSRRGAGMKKMMC